MDWTAMYVCPACHGELEHGDVVICLRCGATYPVESGVPLLFHAMGAPDSHRPETQVALGGLPVPLRTALRRLRSLLVPRSRVHLSRKKRALVPNFVASVPGPVVNIGSGTKRYGDHVLNLDIEPMDGVDVCGVAEHLPLRTSAFDGAVLQAVLEHVEDAEATLAELNRVLRPGGTVFVDVPFMQGYHGAPSDFRRFTELGLQRELERHGFEVTGTGVSVGPGSAASWILAEYLATLLSIGSRSYRASRLVTRWLTWPLKWTDAWLDRHPMAFVVASGVWAEGRKRDEPN